MKRFRLSFLLAVLALVIIYAVATDHPAPAWGASQLPELFISVFFYLFVTIMAWSMWQAWRGGKTTGPKNSSE